MSDTRHKNANWRVSEPGQTPTWQGAQLAVLMDIRDELQALNRTLGCFRVRRALDDLNRIDKRLAKKIKLRG